MPLTHDEQPHGFTALDHWTSPEAVEERERRQAEAKARKREARFGRVGFAALRSQKAQPPDFVIDDWMVAREVSFFAGESEAGKTFLAIDIAFRVALGWPVFGRRVKRGLVIYQIGESGDSLTKLRIPAWMEHFGADLRDTDVPLEVLKSRVNLATADTRATDGPHALLDTIRNISVENDMPVSLVLIDTFSKAFVGGNENDGKDVSRVIANAEMIAKETGAHVAIIHHFPKGGSTLRGHGSLRADVDSVAMVRSDPQTKIRTIKLDKLKDGEKADMQFELMQIRLGQRDDGKPITSCVVLPVGDKAKEREAASNAINITKGENTFLRAFFAALDKSGSTPPADFDCPSSAKVVDYELVRATFYEMNPPQEVDSGLDEDAQELARRRHKETVRKALKRASDDLARKIAIGVKLHTAADGKEAYLAWWKGRPIRGFRRTYPPKPKQAEDNVDAVIAQEGADWIGEMLS